MPRRSSRLLALPTALVCGAASSCAPTLPQSSHVLRPGMTITGLGGVRVSAPPLWREGPVSGVQLTIIRMPPNEIAWPLEAGLRLGTPVYRVQTDQAVLSGDQQSFQVALPLNRADPALLFGHRLSLIQLDSDGPGGTHVTWSSDDSARFEGGHVTFKISGFVDDTHLFTTSVLDIPFPVDQRRSKP